MNAMDFVGTHNILCPCGESFHELYTCCFCFLNC